MTYEVKEGSGHVNVPRKRGVDHSKHMIQTFIPETHRTKLSLKVHNQRYAVGLLIAWALDEIERQGIDITEAQSN